MVGHEDTRRLGWLGTGRMGAGGPFEGEGLTDHRAQPAGQRLVEGAPRERPQFFRALLSGPEDMDVPGGYCVFGD